MKIKKIMQEINEKGKRRQSTEDMKVKSPSKSYH
jgi:hypothetical protein